MHKNKINGKVYIGITCQEVNRRWVNGFGYRKGTYFYNAIMKYKWDGFYHEIIAENLFRKEACEMEAMLIKLYKSTDRNYGYNMTYGGESNIPTQETRAKISRANIGEYHPNYGKKLSKEQRLKISKSLKGRFVGDKSPCYGRKVSEETRKKMRDNHYDCSGKNNPRFGKGEDIAGKNNVGAKKVMNLDTGVIFDTITDAAKYYNAPRTHISSCCKGNRNMCGGFRWMYFDDYKKLHVSMKEPSGSFCLPRIQNTGG